MSALRAPAAAPRPAAPTRRAPLTALPGGRAERGRRLDAVRAPLQARSGVPFLALCATVLVAALLTALVLNTAMVHGSYEMARLQAESGRAAQDVQTKQERLSAAENALQAKAAALGMVPAGNATMLDVGTGRAVGSAGASK